MNPFRRKHRHEWTRFADISRAEYSAMFPVGILARHEVAGRMFLFNCACGARRSEYQPVGPDDWAFLDEVAS